MAISTLRGTLLALVQNETWDFDPARGYIYRTDYVGAGQAQMQALQYDYVRAGVACRLTFHRGDSCSLEVEDATQAYTIDTWQIVGNDENRDGLSHPVLASTLAAASLDADKIINQMRAHLKNDDDPTALFAAGGDFYGAPPIVKAFYSLQLRGSEEYRHSQYVLRHTTNAPNRYTANISDVGVEMVYSTSKLLTECQNSGLWIFPLPARLAYKIGQIVLPPPFGVLPPNASAAGYTFGWLKSPSTETTAANNRIDITTEYTLELWSSNDNSGYGYYTPY